MDFELVVAIDDMGAGFREFVAPEDIGFFVESGFDFVEDGGIDAVFSGVDESLDDAGVVGDAVECNFDSLDRGVCRGFLDKVDDWVIGMVGEVKHDIVKGGDREERIGMGEVGMR